MSNDRPRYNPAEIEPRWQRRWEQDETFKARRRPGSPKLYVLDMFPYPSGSGLHVGHPEGYTATDIVCRYKRMRGFDVLHPMGWDAFGLPAEQHAIETGEPPAVNTAKNIANFTNQLKSLGFSYDWSREINTTDAGYVRWTQWIFLKLFERGLAYQAEIPVNWCPALGTVLANEEVIDGRSDRGNHPVVRTPLRQWMLKITAYAERLLADLDGLDWPETKGKQAHWIGRSDGAELRFPVVGHEGLAIDVFTTRPDTIYGATYMVLAPEHAMVEKLVTAEQRAEVIAYRDSVASKSDMARTAIVKTKTGVFTGAYATNPITGARTPIWVADFVLAAYGSGAIMSVPAHDQRDFEFARQFGLPVVEVVSADGQLHDASTWKEAFTGEGVAVRSGLLDGKKTAEAKAAMIDHVEREGLGKRQVNYKLRDWVFSRQRYWGEPIPIYFPVELHAGSTDPRTQPHTIRYDQPIAVADSELPLELPQLTDYKPGDDPLGPLARAVDWRYFQKEGRWYARETNTMPQWAGSCWYYLRFLDPKNAVEPWSKQAYDDWMPVDLYVGGGEHAVLHLLYARFWHKVLFDCGYVSHPEPFQKLVHQGIILGEVEFTALRDTSGKYVSFDEAAESAGTEHSHVRKGTGEPLRSEKIVELAVEKRGGKFYLVDEPAIVVDARAHKMSKSRKNIVNPDDIVAAQGADALRVYEMFMGPLEAMKPWQTNGVVGVRRFLDRAFAVCTGATASATLDEESNRLLHKTVQKVGDDIEHLRLNTSVSAMMILTNRFAELPSIPIEAAEKFALILSPFAPHLAEEIWEKLGHDTTLAHEPWPSFDPALVVDDVVEIAVQVNGKVRSRVKLSKDATEADARAAVAGDEAVLAFTAGKAEKKFLYVPGRIINVVVG
jgi:leucyl-tRNA synthetase